MKKLGLIVGFLMFTIASTFAQRNNIAPEIQASRDMMAVEKKMLNENTDAEGIKLIKEHQAAKRKLDATMKKIPGYGKSATDKVALLKFREKNAKKDPSFRTLSDKEKETRLAKENYISGVNEMYKENITISKGK